MIIRIKTTNNFMLITRLKTVCNMYLYTIFIYKLKLLTNIINYNYKLITYN